MAHLKLERHVGDGSSSWYTFQSPRSLPLRSVVAQVLLLFIVPMRSEDQTWESVSGGEGGIAATSTALLSDTVDETR